MSNTAVHDHDHSEPLHNVLLSSGESPRRRWRQIILVLHAQELLNSISNDHAGGIVELSPHVSLQIDSDRSESQSYSNDQLPLENIARGVSIAGDSDSKLTGTINISTPSPHVSLDVHSDEDGGHNYSNRTCQLVNIARIVKAKDLVSLHNFGGVQGIAEALDTNLEKGIPGSEEDPCSWRIAAAQSKAQAPARGFFRSLLKSCNSCIIFLLLVSAVLSLGFGIKEEGARTGWFEGLMIILAVIILVLFPAMRDYWHESLQEFSGRQKLSKNGEILVDVFRGGRLQKISISNVVLGDVVCLKRGHQVPADGLFICGEFLDLDDCSESIDAQHPFLFYGSKVINGNGCMLVTCVGMNTAWGEMMSRVTNSPKKTLLQAQLDKVNTRTQIIGLIISIFIIVALFLRFKLGKDDDNAGLPDLKGKNIASKELMEAIKRIVMKPSGKLSILTTSLTMLLVGVVEGLPFVIALAINYWNKKTLSDKALAQDTSACVTMGLVTTICIDKTGGLTLNPMEVDMCWIGEEVITEDSVIASDVLEALCDGISTPVLIPQSPCTSTDDSLLSWAELKLGKTKLEILKRSCTIVLATEANFNNEGSGVLMRKNGGNETNMCLHWKGPASTILPMCSQYHDSKGATEVMDENKKLLFKQIIEHMQSKDLKIIAFAYKQTKLTELEDNNLILIGLLGLKQICWIEISTAMEVCRHAGVSIKLVSEDDVSLLKTIAEKCGILMPNSDVKVMEGEEFRNWTDKQKKDMVDQIAVMGNASPSDKLLLVQYLKQKNHIVAVVGVRTTETPALKEADVGLAMGTWSSKLVRESSDIFILDGNVSLLANLVRRGRCAYCNIRKYIQLELTMTIAGLLITSITKISLGFTPITTVQLVWATLIVTLFGGLALLIEPCTEKPMDKQPVSRAVALITKVMWRNIITQAFYQVTILVTFLYKGQAIPGINQKVSKSMIFNSFVVCQVFNIFNARYLEKKNVFEGFHQNHWFWVGVGLTMVLQTLFIEIESILDGHESLNGQQWAICFLIGMVSWVINLVGKCTSDFIKDWFIFCR